MDSNQTLPSHQDLGRLTLLGSELNRYCESILATDEIDQNFDRDELARIRELSALAERLGQSISLTKAIHTASRIIDTYSEERFTFRKFQEVSDFISHWVRKLTDIVENERVNREHLLQQEIDRLTGTLNQLEQKTSDTLQKVEHFSKERINELNEQKAAMARVLGENTVDALSKDFNESATREKADADKYRIWAFRGMLAVIVLAAFIFLISTEKSLSPSYTVLKSLLILVASAPAAYFSRESTRHREFQHLYQQTYLDLRSIAPYLAPLSTENKERVMSELALKIFAYRKTDSKNNQNDDTGLREIAMRLVDKLPTGKS